METSNPPGSLARNVADAARFWEPRRLLYNAVLSTVALAWVVVSWPHFRPAQNLSTLLLIGVLALLANVCYCAAYLVDIAMQRSGFRILFTKRRRFLWSAGMLFAILLENYWIADEIYPFVR
jgi:hypothetical protein